MNLGICLSASQTGVRARSRRRGRGADAPRAGADLRRPPGAPPDVTPPHANIYHCTSLPQEPRYAKRHRVQSRRPTTIPALFFAHTSAIHIRPISADLNPDCDPLGRSLVQLAHREHRLCRSPVSQLELSRSVVDAKAPPVLALALCAPWTPPRQAVARASVS